MRCEDWSKIFLTENRNVKEKHMDTKDKNRERGSAQKEIDLDKYKGSFVRLE